MKQGVFKYRPEVDGLRAIAVVAVLLYHTGLGVTGGYVGVDVFFVISGYLITKLLLKDIEQNKFSVLDFWERRIRRIFPALYVMVIVTLILGYFLFLPWDYEKLGRSAMMQSIFASNFYFWSDSGYFAGASELKPLLHTWSLAVEEQFYFIFPTLLFFLMKKSAAITNRVVSLICVVSFIVSIFGVYYFASATFYLLPMRAWELLLGSLLALGVMGSAKLSNWLNESVSVAGMLMIFWSIFFFTESTRFPGASALVPCLGALLFIYTNEKGLTYAGKIMSLKPIVFVGLISYSLYLWHWPLIAFYNRIFVQPLDAYTGSLICVLSFICAILSWYFVERPFRKGGLLKTRLSVYKVGGTVALIAALLGLALDGLDGIPSRVPSAVMEIGIQERNPDYQIKTTMSMLEEQELISFGPEVERASDASFLLWGDSHAIAVAPVLEELSQAYDISGVASLRSATPPMLDVWMSGSGKGKSIIPYNHAVVDYVSANQIEYVFIAARWSNYYHREDGVLVDIANGKVDRAYEVEAFKMGLQRAIDALNSAGAKVFLLAQVPDQLVDIPLEIAECIWRGRQPVGIGITLQDHLNLQEGNRKILDSFISSGFVVLDPSSLFFDAEGESILLHEGKSIYRDNDHVSDAGASYMKPVFQPAFEEMKLNL